MVLQDPRLLAELTDVPLKPAMQVQHMHHASVAILSPLGSWAGSLRACRAQHLVKIPWGPLNSASWTFQCGSFLGVSK